MTPDTNNRAGSDCQERLVRHLLDALKRIAECQDSPDIDPGGEEQFGLHCGVEDRGCCDRYEGADYGYSRGMERGLEWASNEAKHALESLPNVRVVAPPSEGEAGIQEGGSK
jgi:hypothetical protein